MKRPLNKSFSCAFHGLWLAFKSERNLKIHLAAALMAIGAGIYLGLASVEWGLVIFAIAFVFAAELFNTAFEYLCNEMSGGKPNDAIRSCKDIAAAAVLVAAVAALIIGVFILIIPLFQRIF